MSVGVFSSARRRCRSRLQAVEESLTSENIVQYVSVGRDGALF
jgi:hypothetical protein